MTLLRLLRVPNLLLMLLAQALVQACLLYPAQPWAAVSWPPFWLTTLSTVAVGAGGYAINDYYDVKIDAVNRPRRRVVGRGGLTRRRTMLLHLFLSAVGVGAGLAVGWAVGAIAAGSALALWAYSAQLKQRLLVGNLVVAGLGAAMVLVVEVAARTHSRTVWVYAALAALLTLIREVIKDAEDMRGDARFNCRTLPIVAGLPRTKAVLYGLILLLGGAMLVVVVRRPEAWRFNGFLLLAVLAPLGLLVAWLRRADRRLHFARLSGLGKLLMLAGMLSMLLYY
ncbi:MAG: geranylgeranylglycerol-phosphate geranylgeranyltransferase [Hymenobacteraceae bacterium]|nr:geranylgeranylglycerol-phosphate geranylgeranyltransferase [Hymenobacteraceae bacterium]